MRICIIGPGILPIPPNGWGATEILIWDYKETLEKLGHRVLIVNTRDTEEIIELANGFDADFVHIQSEDFACLDGRFKCKNIAATSHSGYLDNPVRREPHKKTFEEFLEMKETNIFCLSPKIAEQYILNGFPKEKIFVTPNGVRDDLFKFNKECLFPSKSIYLGRIDRRKRQRLFQNIESLLFVGNIGEAEGFDIQKNYLGEWGKETLYNNLTNYANLVLLSDGEAHPLVCIEALSAGLGLVISEFASANLNIELPYIDIIPESKINDIQFIEDTIIKNREKSIGLRPEIREYAINNFSWKVLVPKYLKIINKL